METLPFLSGSGFKGIFWSSEHLFENNNNNNVIPKKRVHQWKFDPAAYQSYEKN